MIALAGNKLDLAEQRQVEIEEAKSYADDNNILFMETSAKTNHNVNEMFKTIAMKLPKTVAAPRSPGVVIDPDNVDRVEQKKGCCS